MKLIKWLIQLAKKPSPHVVPKDKCLHPEWWPETKENEWRSSCKACGQKAYGSCQ